MKLRIIFHLGFWAFFTLFFWQQNPRANSQEYTILLACAMVVYTNLYFLLPHYFVTRRYFTYSFFLIVVVGLGALFLKFIFLTGKSSFEVPVLQNLINLFVFVIITSSLKFLREYSRKQKALIKAETEQLKTELSLLKAQINPHFLFNTLNNLYGLIVQNQNQKAAELTIKLSNLMRYILEISLKNTVSLNREITFLEDYLVLERIRFSAKVDIRFEVYGLEKDVFVAPLLFIPLVENAFKHGLQTISNNSYAHFSLSIQGNELYFEAVNSVGQNITTIEKKGTGLENLRKRLELTYPEKYLLEVEHNEGIFKVVLQISI